MASAVGCDFTFSDVDIARLPYKQEKHRSTPSNKIRQPFWQQSIRKRQIARLKAVRMGLVECDSGTGCATVVVDPGPRKTNCQAVAAAEVNPGAPRGDPLAFFFEPLGSAEMTRSKEKMIAFQQICFVGESQKRICHSLPTSSLSASANAVTEVVQVAVRI